MHLLTVTYNDGDIHVSTHSDWKEIRNELALIRGLSGEMAPDVARVLIDLDVALYRKDAPNERR